MPSIEELMKLINDYHLFKNEDDSLSSLVLSNTQKELKEYSHLFTIKAKEFEYYLREEFTKEKKANFSKVKLNVNMKNIDIGNSSICYHIKLVLSIQNKKSVYSKTLTNLYITTKYEMEDEFFNQKLFEMNVLPILLSNNFQNSKVIKNACWNVVFKNINNILINNKTQL